MRSKLHSRSRSHKLCWPVYGAELAVVAVACCYCFIGGGRSNLQAAACLEDCHPPPSAKLLRQRPSVAAVVVAFLSNAACCCSRPLHPQPLLLPLLNWPFLSDAMQCVPLLQQAVATECANIISTLTMFMVSRASEFVSRELKKLHWIYAYSNYT